MPYFCAIFRRKRSFLINLSENYEERSPNKGSFLFCAKFTWPIMKRMLKHVRRKTDLGDLKGGEPGGVHWVRVPITFSFLFYAKFASYIMEKQLVLTVKNGSIRHRIDVTGY